MKENKIVLDHFSDDPEEEERIIKRLQKAEENIENGRVRDAEEVHKEWRLMYGVPNKL